jgi:hypothetical protein
MTTVQAPTLTIFRNDTPIFTSYGTWLHPLFELEAYLAEHSIQPESLILQVKSSGRRRLCSSSGWDFRQSKLAF